MFYSAKPWIAASLLAMTVFRGALDLLIRKLKSVEKGSQRKKSKVLMRG